MQIRTYIIIIALLSVCIAIMLPLIGLLPEDDWVVQGLQGKEYKYRMLIGISSKSSSIGNEQYEIKSRNYLTFPPLNYISVKKEIGLSGVNISSNESVIDAYVIVIFILLSGSCLVYFFIRHKAQ